MKDDLKVNLLLLYITVFIVICVPKNNKTEQNIFSVYIDNISHIQLEVMCYPIRNK